MQHFAVLVSFLTTIVGCFCSAPLFVIPCSLSDPQLNACAMKSANRALPIIIKGDKQFKIPNLDPVRIPQVLVDGQNLKIKFTDVVSNVLSRANIEKISIDDKAKTWSFTFSADVLDLAGNYDIKGRILVLAITGQGPANVTYTKPVYTYTLKYKDVQKNGRTYIDIVDSENVFTFERTYFRFENLFGGDGTLGEEMNSYLNENWEAFETELHPVVIQTVGGIVGNIFKNIFAKASKDELFLP